MSATNDSSCTRPGLNTIYASPNGFKGPSLGQRGADSKTLWAAAIINTEGEKIFSITSVPMSTDAVELRLKFLKQAARKLAVPSPTIAATIGAAHDNLLAAEDRDAATSRKDWDALRRGLCGSCGNVMVPGWSCKVSHRSRLTKRSKTSLEPSSKPEKQLVYSCLRCDRRTIQALPSRPPKHIRSKIGMKDDEPLHAVPTNALADGDSKVAKSVNATSKQRKKARKGGLQAMLDKNKTSKSAQGGLGLDLMDFMQ